MSRSKLQAYKHEEGSQASNDTAQPCCGGKQLETTVCLVWWYTAGNNCVLYDGVRLSISAAKRQPTRSGFTEESKLQSGIADSPIPPFSGDLLSRTSRYIALCLLEQPLSLSMDRLQEPCDVGQVEGVACGFC